MAFLVCLLVSAGAVGALGTLGVTLYAKSVERSVRRGWLLVPVVVAARDLGPGTRLSVDLLTQRAIPDTLVTSADVRPEAITDLLGRRLAVPVAGGEPLRVSFVAEPTGSDAARDADVLDACADEVSRRWRGGEVHPALPGARERTRRAP